MTRKLLQDGAEGRRPGGNRVIRGIVNVLKLRMRRKSVNQTGIERIETVEAHAAWIAFSCIKCSHQNTIKVGPRLLAPDEAYHNEKWECGKCRFVHCKGSDLPFDAWPKALCMADSIAAQRFWVGFFRIATEHPSSYWKQCNTCGRIQPFQAYSRHAKWWPLERQMECRSCKGAINAVLNPKRTKEQLREANRNRRIADLLLEGEGETIEVDGLFHRFDSRCFKCHRELSQTESATWHIDHILPSRYLYPLTVANAGLLCRDCNSSKRDQWPSSFFTNSELIDLAKKVGADLSVLASTEAIVNENIDVNACVTKALSVRERSMLRKRIAEVRHLLSANGLLDKLSAENKRLLGIR